MLRSVTFFSFFVVVVVDWVDLLVSCCSLNQVLLGESVRIIIVVCTVVLESSW